MGAVVVSRLRILAIFTVIAVMAAVLTTISPLSARADTAPPDPATPITAAADSLPTVQINGVVWAQLIVGNTVYVGGEFTQARPAGAAAGTNQTPRNNLLAYNLTTGALITSFNPNVNAQVRALVASPDGSRIYAGGSFTAVGGVARYRVAAFSTATGALVSTWAPALNARVNALGVTGNTLYVGGIFSAAGTVARNGIAAFATSNGALQAWAGEPTGGSVNALVVSPDGSKVVIGGSFTAYNGGNNPGYGLAATDAASGASLPWKVNGLIRNGGTQAAILSLAGSDKGVFGTGYVFGSGGNLEGTFRASWDDGTLIWMEDCHGDTYSVAPVNDVVYTTEHAHYCGNIGGFPQANPWTYHRTLTFSMDVGGTITADPLGYYNFAGQPRPNLLTFYPDINTGTYTGQGQGPWNVAANDKYVLYGGEFTVVNNKGQQGLSRFATPDIAPNKEGPRVKDTSFVSSDFVPAVASFIAGTARLSWKAAYDRDNEHLTYEVLRDGVSVKTIEANSTDWFRPNLGWTDTGLTPGQTYSYRLRVSDPKANVRTGDPASVTIAQEGSLNDYAKAVLADSPRSYWPFGEPSGTTAFDWTSGFDATTNSGVTRNVPGAVVGDPATASRFDGSSTGFATTNVAEDGSNSFSVEAWIKTTTTRGGKIIGFGNSQTGTSNSYDRHVYMDNSGRIWFGVYPGSVQTVNSTTAYNDGAWHQVVASLGAGGMALYIDGKRVAQRADVTTGQVYQGYWRVGGDNLNGWSGQPASNFIAADIDEVALYSSPLTPRQVAAHYGASGRTSPIPPVPADSYGAAVYNAEPDLYWRLGESTGSIAADASASGNAGTYFGAVSKGAPGLVSGTGNSAATFNGGVVGSNAQFSNPRTYSLEAWFSTTTNQGGKLIGFGNQQSGLSSNYDRHVYMQDDGKLVFGTWTGQTNLVTSTAAYNDGQTHHMVATQSGDGMKLYVDGALVGTNPQTAAQSYSGYWRIGGDTTWGSSSPYFAGTLDEVAVYPQALSASAVANHYSLGTNGAPANVPPTAAFVTTANRLALGVDASTSSDSDGSVTGWAWDFGDGTTASGVTASHIYARAGTYAVKLTVTDNRSATGVTTQQVVVADNASPVASFTHTETFLRTDVDAASSSDPDGTITGWAWNFGDGATANTRTASHTYANAGSYDVSLTVTDNDGATTTATQTVAVAAAPANQPPTASFTATASPLSVAVDGRASTDPDGTIAGWAWDFGDGGTATGATTTHPYAAAGTYAVVLTVTDNQGLTNSSTKQVVVPDQPANPLLASDAFGRTVSNGLGTADLGGAWSVTTPANNYSVSGGTASFRSPTAGAMETATLPGVSSTSTDAQVTFALQQPVTGSAAYVSVLGRTIGSDDYRARLRVNPNGSASLQVMRGGVSLASVTVPGFTYVTGEQLNLRVQVTGTAPTTIRARVWRPADAEPTTWLASATDGTAAMQAAGGVGLALYLGGTATVVPMFATFDNLVVKPVG
ncbi:PKD domain-containing protein [Glaciibacter sp. 2TAF33]|uniref:PKD domain-containing protein n=1 Tax=Glaciibacter sp. 2TAF33 TaxID=3233015 RepID=UPI003F8DB323